MKTHDKDLKNYLPQEADRADKLLLLVVDDTEISIIHDMALYRQSRVALEHDKKKAKTGAFFDVEALPEGTVMIFPVAMRKKLVENPVQWQQFIQEGKFQDKGEELYFGGLESIGFGRTKVFLKSVSESDK